MNKETAERIDELERQVLYYDSKIDDLIQNRARAAEKLRKIKAGGAIKSKRITLDRVNLMNDGPRVNDVRNFVSVLRERGTLRPFIEWNGSIYSSNFRNRFNAPALCHISDLPK